MTPTQVSQSFNKRLHGAALCGGENGGYVRTRAESSGDPSSHLTTSICRFIFLWALERAAPSHLTLLLNMFPYLEEDAHTCSGGDTKTQ